MPSSLNLWSFRLQIKPVIDMQMWIFNLQWLNFSLLVALKAEHPSRICNVWLSCNLRASPGLDLELQGLGTLGSLFLGCISIAQLFGSWRIIGRVVRKALHLVLATDNGLLFLIFPGKFLLAWLGRSARIHLHSQSVAVKMSFLRSNTLAGTD